MIQAHLAHLKRIERRLAASDTRIKRKHARSELRKLLRTIERQLLVKYPVIGKDGLEKINKARHPACPVCGAPMKNFVVLADHATNRHGCKSRGGVPVVWSRTCWCGKVFEHSPDGLTQFARHLAGIKDLKRHAAPAMLSRLVGGR